MLGRDVLGVFVKAPTPGQVKTRLAAGVGARQAARIYHTLGRRVVAACIGPGHATVVWFAPAGAGAAVRAWLNGLAVTEFRAQASGELGTRLGDAFDQHFREGAHRVVVIGSDSPGVSHRLVARAFAALDDHELVIGPARDGGYYLLGLRAPAPDLFRGISWSTDLVLGETMARAQWLGLEPLLLPALRDVDTVSDARAAGLLR